MSIKDLIELVAKGSPSLIILVIWIYTHKSNAAQNKAASESASAQHKDAMDAVATQNKSAMEALQKAVDLANTTSSEAFKNHAELLDVVIQILKDEQDYKIVLTGVMDRMDTKLSVPAQCPLLIAGNKIKVEVTG